MRLLFDQNLSHTLVAAFMDLFPGSIHVREVGLQHAADEAIWEFAKAGGFTIISQDEDFHQRSFLFGFPPKVIWLRLGNASTEEIEETIRKNANTIGAFENDATASFLLLG